MEILDRPVCVVVDEVAIGVEIHWRRRGKLGAMNSGCAQPRGNAGCIGRALQVELARQVAPPARIGAANQPRQLSKLRLAPFHVDLERHLLQFSGRPDRSLHPHGPRLPQFQAHVSASRLPSKAYLPFPITLLREGELRIDQREGKFLNSILEVDSGVGGL